MKKYEVVKKRKDFNLIISTCSFIKNKYFTIYIKKRENNFACFGLAISKKVGNAVTRNNLKRKIRAIIDQHKENFAKNCDYIIMIKRECVLISFHELEKNLVDLIKEKK